MNAQIESEQKKTHRYLSHFEVSESTGNLELL